MAMQTVNLEFEITNQDVINGTKNFVCSQQYIERIVKVSVVNILFHRLPIPDNMFVTKEFNSIPYRAISMERTGTGIGQLYRKWITGFKDAFRKKYLKEFILFFSDDSQTIHENFKFKFQYEGRIDIDKACSDLTDPTEWMLKNLITLGDMPKLHSNIHMHVELFYFEEKLLKITLGLQFVYWIFCESSELLSDICTLEKFFSDKLQRTGTPSNYRPPLFDNKDYQNTLKSKMGEENYEPTTLARINTGFHYFNFSCKRKSNESQFLRDSQRETELKKRRKSKAKDVTKITDPAEIDLYATKVIEETKKKWNISERELQSLTSIDLISDNQSRVGISFDMDYGEIPDDEDIDMIADSVKSPQSNILQL